MDTTVIDSVTHDLVASGHRVFQIHRFAGGEQAHVTRLARWAELPVGSRVADLGCGTGEVARIMKEQRPDLSFVLVNLSLVQLQYAPDHFTKHHCDFCSVPEHSGSFDAAMFCFSIGHAHTPEAMGEAARLLTSGGVLFIYDMVRIAGDNSAMHAMQYAVHNREAMERAASDAGFALDLYLEPTDSGAYGTALFGTDFNEVFGGTKPACWRFVKR